MGHAIEYVRRLLAERISPELSREALQDPLTGALIMRADRAATARALAHRAAGTRVVRLRADLDNFKALNDVRGHCVGDAALCVVREALELATRDIDLVSLARPGGDEFALTLCVAAGSKARSTKRWRARDCSAPPTNTSASRWVSPRLPSSPRPRRSTPQRTPRRASARRLVA